MVPSVLGLCSADCNPLTLAPCLGNDVNCVYEFGQFDCVRAGTGTVDQPCAQARDCNIGLACDFGIINSCLRWCAYPTGAICDANETCASASIDFHGNELGFCRDT